MARPKKEKRVCREPDINIFGPHMDSLDMPLCEIVEMTVEEFETIRLIDYEGFTQVECGEAMGVGRSTVQRLYEIARKKIADSLVNGKMLKIEGGDYKLCDQIENISRCGKCYRNRHRGGRNR